MPRFSPTTKSPKEADLEGDVCLGDCSRSEPMDRSMSMKSHCRWLLVLAGAFALEGSASAQTPQLPPQEQPPAPPPAAAVVAPAAEEKIPESARVPPASQPG